jgi:hypothetical protein
MEKRALIVSGVVPNSDVAEMLIDDGYSIMHEHRADDALASLDARVPAKAIVGPFVHDSGTEELLRALAQLGVEVLVLADDERTLEIAARLKLPCQWIGAND